MDRVQKILSNYGYCSRRKAEELIEQGKVKVNGKKAVLGDKAQESDTIEVLGKQIKKPRKTYIIFHKPKGCVCALTDKHEKTVMDYIKVKERVFPIGRLDKHTTGLLLLTNDGDFANQILHPRYEIKKTYVAQVSQDLNDKEQEKIRKGIVLSDGKSAPAKVRKVAPKTYEITIHEGKNRIVRRMIEALGYKVLNLHRSKIGNLSLDVRYSRYQLVTRKQLEKCFIKAKEHKKSPFP